MNSLEAVNLVDILLKQNNLPFLSHVERELLSDTWNNHNYEKTAFKLHYTCHYTRHLAGQMWKRLSPLFPKPVNKQTIHEALYQSDLRFYAPEVHSNQDITLPEYYQPRDLEAKLSQNIIQDYYRVIGIFGMMGTGKSALAQGIIQGVARDLEMVIWHSFAVEMLSFSEWMEKVMSLLLGQPVSLLAVNPSEQIKGLLQLLQKRRCLLVLDQLEQLFLPTSVPGKFHKDYLAYQELIKSLAMANHQSYLILTSREYPQNYAYELNKIPFFQALHLEGLSFSQASQLLDHFRMTGHPKWVEQLQKDYDRNPFALIKASSYIKHRYQGNIKRFIQQQDLMFKPVLIACNEVFQRLSAVEKEVMFALQFSPKRLTKTDLFSHASHLSRLEVNEALERLQARSLLKVSCGFVIISSFFQAYIRTIAEKGTVQQLTTNSGQLTMDKRCVSLR